VTASAGDRPVDVVRHGALPVNATYGSLQEHDAALLWDMQALADRDVPWSQMAILCQTNRMAEEYADLLAQSGIPCALLKSKKPRVADAVHVGTWFRSKGMEFPHVFLPQADQVSRLFTGGGAQARQERDELMRRTMYVAMTRARDTLWVGRLQSSTARSVS
jgi:ATP-dependent exoDNAse (exonuclease V) beta subunit